MRTSSAQFWSQVLRETARDSQSDEIDMRVETHGDRARLVVDLMEDAARFRNDATIEADVSFVPAGAVGSSLQPIAQHRLDQVASGRHAGEFDLGDAGVYLVRARSGAQMVSGGLVRNVPGETATGRVNTTLLERVTAITGGAVVCPQMKARVEELGGIKGLASGPDDSLYVTCPDAKPRSQTF
jgi:hypothetical protein